MTNIFDLEILTNDDFILCKTCNEIKHRDEFYLRKDGYLQRPCRKCTAERIRLYRFTDIGNRKAKSIKIKHLYGMTLTEYENYINNTTNCSICGKEFTDNKKCLDHCHYTGKIRGVLCNSCNLKLGWYENNKENILRYLPYNPFTPVKDFERQLSKYTGAPFVVTVTSCTSALFLVFLWHRLKHPNVDTLEMPKHSYIGVPIHMRHAKYKIKFRDEDWRGIYKINPFEIYDSARRFTKNMYIPDSFMCVSFHYSKILSLTQGGAILHNDLEFDKWARRMRFDGRVEGVDIKDDRNIIPGLHCYMGPEVASQGLVKLHHMMNKHNDDLPNDDYPDLSKFKCFRS